MLHHNINSKVINSCVRKNVKDYPNFAKEGNNEYENSNNNSWNNTQSNFMNSA